MVMASVGDSAVAAATGTITAMAKAMVMVEGIQIRQVKNERYS